MEVVDPDVARPMWVHPEEECPEAVNVPLRQPHVTDPLPGRGVLAVDALVDGEVINVEVQVDGLQPGTAQERGGLRSAGGTSFSLGGGTPG